MDNFKLPKEIEDIISNLKEAGFKAYIVGGCVRDILLNEDPKDWDITTDAKPEEIQKIFPDSLYENKFGTVAVKSRSEEKDVETKVVEITTFRLEEGYRDKRHPDKVKFAETIEEDLARRDFTINAIALDLNADLVDPHGGWDDLKKRIIRTVGDPEKRFNEDALRLMRAVRFSVQLGFGIEKKTLEALKSFSGNIKDIAKERIRDEFVKIIMTPRASEGLILLEETSLLENIIPELKEGIGCAQNKHHVYTVFEHNVKALEYAVKKNYSLEIRLASLFHDIGKPRSKRGKGQDATFHGHEVVGARMAARILDRLCFSKEISEKVVHLIRFHMFYYNVGDVSESGVRRFLRRVGPENVDDLMMVREADRIGSRVPKAFPYKLRHLKFMIDKVKQDPVHPKMLRIKGDDVMSILNIEPGPRVGWILNVLLEEVLDDPVKNDMNYLEKKVAELGKLTDNELKEISDQAKEKKEEFEEDIEEEMKKKYHVK